MSELRFPSRAVRVARSPAPLSCQRACPVLRPSRQGCRTASLGPPAQPHPARRHSFTRPAGTASPGPPAQHHPARRHSLTRPAGAIEATRHTAAQRRAQGTRIGRADAAAPVRRGHGHALVAVAPDRPARPPPTAALRVRGRRLAALPRPKRRPLPLRLRRRRACSEAGQVRRGGAKGERRRHLRRGRGHGAERLVTSRLLETTGSRCPAGEAGDSTRADSDGLVVTRMG